MRATSAYQEEMGFTVDFRFRRTPPGQPKVPDLVQHGTAIRTSYGTGGLVSAVCGPYIYRATNGRVYEHYTIEYVREEHWNAPHSKHLCWLNELVAVNGRLLHLFEANDDEVFILNKERNHHA